MAWMQCSLPLLGCERRLLGVPLRFAPDRAFALRVEPVHEAGLSHPFGLQSLTFPAFGLRAPRTWLCFACAQIRDSCDVLFR